MTLIVTNITDLEHELIRSFFEKKMDALQRSENKNFAWTGFDKSKFLKTIINGKTFIVGAGNVFRTIVEDVLLKACSTYPECFGKRDAKKVVDAIYDTRPLGKKESFKDFLQNEQFALIFNMDQNGKVGDKVLRIDLFRDIKPELNNPLYNEFIRGLFHALKHFNCNGQPLSTNLEKYSVDHPNEIFELIINGFFLSKYQKVQSRKGFTTVYPLDTEKDVKCAFYEEEKSGVYFLNTLHIKARKLPRKEKKRKSRKVIIESGLFLPEDLSRQATSHTFKMPIAPLFVVSCIVYRYQAATATG